MSALGSSDILIIAEKPSVARDIARVVGASRSGEGVLSGGGYQVTWAFGHLVALPEPHEIHPDWKMWRKSSLPMFPDSWPLKVIEQTRAQFRIIQSLLESCEQIICATDAGREGELIFRYILEAAGMSSPKKGGRRFKKPLIQRLWVSSLTADAIRAGLDTLRESRSYDGLADAARARSQADWLVGMNYSRAYALLTQEPLFVGRVQTPTLGLVVKRDLEIRNFKPETYFELIAEFESDSQKYLGHYLGESRELSSKEELPKPKRLPIEGALAQSIQERVKTGDASIASVENKTLRQPPLLLYDLTELQRHANRLFGFSASQTLELAQALYEKHKLISYPRTDSRHLSMSVAKDLPQIVAAIRGPYEKDLVPGTGQSELSLRFVNDAEVTDHHAIIPTEISPLTRTLREEEKKIYDLICRRLLSAWQGDYVTALTTVLTEVVSSPSQIHDVFRTQGTVIQSLGWKRLELWQPQDKEGESLPSHLEKGLLVNILEVQLKKKTTEPPPHLTEATLLSAMETAGRKLEDRELAKAMRESGLGTSATRASIIETLLSRKYLERQGKFLVSTSLGERLIETVHDAVKSPELTARWERDLARIQRSEKTFDDFMQELKKEIQETIKKIFSGEDSSPRALLNTPSIPSGDLISILKNRFGFEKFRPHQEEICQAVTEGSDVLVVMPTGAGKSLCYQLPGVARGGTTLVISPLVALIDDQTAKLRALGLRADRIHSGRSREDSRACCLQYLSGQLDFLFVAPERLALSGFIEMLKKRRPSLIAIDEAHCISQWGHDFRPNYRLLGERLEEFRPVPVVALTATATPLVQNDIVNQLGFKKERRFIQGFRRENIAIQVLNVPQNQRLDAALTLLKGKQRCPAIIYAPTRKAAESLCQELKAHFRVEVYHAGMPSSARDRTQELYLGGKLDVIVATIAFGMGIDKADVRTVIHAGLPGSIEGYYQEIGRAGRDGLPSQAFLMHSFADQKTHEFFFERDYPDSQILVKIYQELSRMGSQSIPKSSLQERLRSIDRDTFDKALEKLWIHQGARIDAEENIQVGVSTWERPYRFQTEHKQKQLREIVNFAQGSGCRMSALIRHFGDQTDSGKPCGICDDCLPESAPFRVERRTLNRSEQKNAATVMAVLAGQDGLAVGRIFQEMGPGVNRGEFELVLQALSRAKWIEIDQASFERSGEKILYRKVSLTEFGRKADGQDLDEIMLADYSPLHLAGGSPKVKSRKSRKRTQREREIRAADSALFETLREWRLTQARRKGVPAFRILSDRVLESICKVQPASEGELLEIQGIGPKIASQYGSDLLRIVQGVS